MTQGNRASRSKTRPAPELPAGPRPGANIQPLTQRGRNTRAKLVRAAREVFSRQRFDEVRITDITAGAGVASGTFYTYFHSKEEVFREVASRVLEEMSAAPRRAPGEIEFDPTRQIEAATRRYFESIGRNARIARSIEELHAREPGVGSARRGILLVGVKRIARWIERLQEQGICDPDLEAWPTAQALHAGRERVVGVGDQPGVDPR